MGLDQNSRSFRLLELLLVSGIAFAPPLLVSFYSLASHSPATSVRVSGALVFNGILFELSALAVLSYVLTRQGRSLRTIGLAFSWIDIPITLLLIVVSYVAFYASYLFVFYGYYLGTNRALTQPARSQTYLDAGITVGTIVFVIVNPFYEELIVRAYLISEVDQLTGSAVLAVVSSVLIQVLYHLYQGVPAALALGAAFLVFSIYYVKYRRIGPVILAHLCFDLFALLFSARH